MKKEFYLKNIMVFIILWMIHSHECSAQSGLEIDKGDKAFDEMLYDEALYNYEQAFDQSPNEPSISRRIAKVYRRIGLPNLSAEWFKKTIDLGSNDAMDLLYYAEALKALGQYDEAVNWYKKFAEKTPADKRAQSHVRDELYFKDLYADTAKYESRKLKINNPEPVIGVTPFEKGKLLISAVNLEQKMIDSTKLEMTNYLDIYQITQLTDFELTKPVKLGANVNTKYHDGPASYCSWDNSLFITRNNVKKNKGVIDKTGSVNTKIYQSKLNNGSWAPAIELPFNGDDYSNAHPSVSSDGQYLYFMSNRPGGFGGTDIYVCQRSGHSWGAPKNLGPSINTEGNEMFPYISNIGTLYFASDGHAGLGGLDIFFSEENKGNWLPPLNMGAPINGTSDDFSLYYDDTADRGYFCSNRAGRGNDDIYFFQFKTLKEMILAGNIKLNDPDISLEGENVRIESVNRGDISERRLDEKGSFQYVAQPGDKVEVRLTDTKYILDDGPIFTYQVPEIITDPYLNIGKKEVNLKYPLNYKGKLSDFKNPELKTGSTTLESKSISKETLNSKNETAVQKQKENSEKFDNLIKEGDELASQEKHEEAITKYKDALLIYPTKEFVKKKVKDQERLFEQKNGKKPRTEYEKATSLIDLETLNIDNILFDYNKAFIRDTDKVNLDKIADIMKNDPDLKVLIKAFCDSRGSITYNQQLSMNRAMAVQGYLMRKGISRDRIQTEWFGESMPLNTCGDGVPCSEQEYEVNRRAEFKLVRK